MFRNKERQKLKELKIWLENVSSIQNKILKILGYEMIHRAPITLPSLFLEKISDRYETHSTKGEK